MGDSLAVKTAEFVMVLNNLAVLLAEARVKAVADRSGVVGLADRREVVGYFLFRKTLFVEVVGAGHNEVRAVFLINALCIEFGIENHLYKLACVFGDYACRKCRNLPLEEFT